MGYRNIEPVLLSIFSLAKECGLFFSGEENGGYCCNSRSKTKSDPGCCYAFDCPLASEANLEDLKKHDEGLYKEYKEHYDKNNIPDHISTGEWVVQYRECTPVKKR